jgi:D-xylose 1-dehydrogenase (NADP+, D-xylono-1,5-lactone-forming)
MGKVRWGVLSTASIGRLVIEATAQAGAAEFVAVASRDAARARAFADELGLGGSFGSYEELLASDEVDAVYVALPVSMHAEWTVRSLQAGKHVLCEKPLALRVEDAERCFDAAAAAGRLCAEGLMWRHHPRTALARRLVADGAIGRLASVRAALSVAVEPGDIRRRSTSAAAPSATSAATASAPSACSPASPSGSGPSRSPTAPAGSTCAWPRPCACPATCSPSSTSASTSPAATSCSWSAPKAS